MAALREGRFKDGRYWISFYSDGIRHRETFVHLRAYQDRKKEILRHQGKGLPVATKHKLAQDESLQYAASLLTETGITKPLTSVVEEYVAATAVLKGRSTVLNACEVYTQTEQKIVPIGVPQLVDNYLAYQEVQKTSKDHRKTLKIYLGNLAKAFQMDVGLVNLHELERWRASLKGEPRTKNNYANAVKALFNYAKTHNHLLTGQPHAADGLKDIDEEPGEANPFTIEEMAILLTEADNESLPYIVLGAFAGIRTAEQKRLTWEENVRWDTGYFDLTGKKTKKKQRRLIPMLPVAQAWLKKFQKQTGPILSTPHPEREPTAVLERYGLKWRHNGLRDSFGSYRSAIVPDIREVAKEMANSPEMITESYREVFSRQKAEPFWDLTPTNAQKIAALAKARRQRGE